MPLAVELRRGSRSVAGQHILKDVSLSLASGEAVAIVGRSGSGKSTLLSCLGLMAPFDKGADYRIDGRDAGGLRGRDMDRLRASHIGFVLQNSNLLSHLSALENVQVPFLHTRDVRLRAGRQRAADILDQIGLGKMLHRKPRELSGGERQRVAIARALVIRPRLLLADEPTGALDEFTGGIVLEQMFELVRGHGTALLLVTHDPAIAERADRTLRLSEGRLGQATAARTSRRELRRGAVAEPGS